MSLLDRLDFRRGAGLQFPIAPQRVLYSKAGNRLAAARVSDATVVIDHTLYWSTAASAEEARYLAAILNSATLTDRVAPLQARGQFGRRHFDKYVFYVPIPIFDPAHPDHQALAALGARAEAIAEVVELPEGVHFQTARRTVRHALEEDGVAGQIEASVATLIAPITT
jgi:hypothetical protein